MDSTAIFWASLCGSNTTFWDPSLTLNTYHPTLSRCFRDTVLVWIPCSVFWISFPFYAFYVRSLPPVNKWRDKTLQNIVTLVLLFCLCAVSAFDVVNQMHFVGGSLSMLAAPLILLCTYIASAILTHFEFCKDIHSNAVQFTFWFLLFICTSLNISAIAMDVNYYEIDYSTTLLVSVCCHSALVVLRTGLTLRSDYVRVRRCPASNVNDGRTHLVNNQYTVIQQELTKRRCPEERAPVWSAVTFTWVLGLMKRGFRKTLTFDDLFDASPRDKTNRVFPVFQRQWNSANERSCSRGGSGGGSGGEGMSLGRFVRVLLPVVWIDLLTSVIYRSVDLFMELAAPVLLSVFISLMETRDPFKWKAYVLAVLLFLSGTIFGVTIHYSIMTRDRAGMRVAVALRGAIYRKCLRLSSKARKKKTMGEIVNMMTVDVGKVDKATFGVIEMLFLPATVVLSMAIIWQYMGPSSLTAVAIILLYIPINLYLAKKYGELQDEQMERKDARLKMVGEILRGIKVLKMYAWEKLFGEKVGVLREEELRVLRRQTYIDVALDVLGGSAIYLHALGMFGTYVLTGHTLTPAVTFSSLSLIENVSWAASVFPEYITQFMEAAVSMRRIISLLEADELDPDAVTRVSAIHGQYGVAVENGTFTWDEDDGRKNTLTDINLDVKRGSLVAVVGQVGAGKSSLLSALLGEMSKLSGTVVVSGTTAYVSQEAWIQNATLQQNILFDTPLDKSVYDDVIDACSLRPDLSVLPAGDQTEIGEKGINLSGGQKQRVALARAVYHNNDVYLLDDPLAAVDAHVSAHLFKKVIGPNGILKDKTRILVTHGLAHLTDCDIIVFMCEGNIAETGTYNELLAKGGQFADMIRCQENSTDSSQESEENPDGTEAAEAVAKRRISRGTSRQKSSVSREEELELTLKKQLSVNDRLIEEEEEEQGSVNRGILRTYFSAFGARNMTLLTAGLLIYCVSMVLNNIWLSRWTDDSTLPHPEHKLTLRLSVYGALGACLMMSVGMIGYVLSSGCIRASRALHARLLAAVLRAPLAFFDTTPQGRILNRFSKDMDGADTELYRHVSMTLTFSAFIVSSFILISYTNPIFIVTGVVIGLIFFLIALFYIRTGRQLLRIFSVRRSPINSHLDESLAGATSIRAFNAQDRFIHKMDRLVDNGTVAFFPSMIVARWIGWSLNCTGCLATLVAALLAASGSDGLTAGMAGLSVYYAQWGAMMMDQVVESACEAEIQFVSVERIDEYSRVEPEAPCELPDSDPPESWPISGDVEFSNYATRYRPGLDLVLKDVSFKIKTGEKIGVVGRTGAGKSSVALSLFRIIEAASGQIIIDGRDVADMGLHCLRSKLTVVPQDPVLFSGSLRQNLEPEGRVDDQELWRALEQASLRDLVRGLNQTLEHDVGEGGNNLSVGQRQLVCLARALLRKSKILVLDEATASIDVQTDDIIQTTIRTAFKDCTVITIAHRINTILDYSRILVMSGGRVVEFDSPDRLLKDPSSSFYKLASQAGVTG